MLVLQSVLWARDREPAELPALSEAVFAGYVAGIRDAGWSGPEAVPRLGYAATAALQYGAFASTIVVGLATDPDRPRFEVAVGATLEAVLERHAAVQPFVLGLADEVRALLAGE